MKLAPGGLDTENNKDQHWYQLEQLTVFNSWFKWIYKMLFSHKFMIQVV